ncbi:hypothetical protein [Morganella psychrotolerans]|uniref:hypothetical protein n=1 Tax=Morganella psychrotolerans TaxID=368603 RepID=UPI0039AEF8A4
MLYPPYLPQMNDGVINIEDIQLTNKIYVEVLFYSDAQAGDEIRLKFGNLSTQFFLVTNPTTNFPIIIEYDADLISDGKYQVSYSSTDLAGNENISPISWAIVDRFNEGVLPPPIFIDADGNNQITQGSINSNNGTHVSIPAYQGISPGEDVDVFYWTLDENGQNVPGSQYYVNHTIINEDITDGFNVLVPKAYLNIISKGTCQARYVVKRNENITENSKIGTAILNLLPVETLPAPDFIDNIDGWLTSNETINGIKVRGEYPGISINDNIELFIFGFDIQGQAVPGTDLSQKLIINSSNVELGYFDITFSKNIATLVGLGRFDSYYTVTKNGIISSSYFGSVNIDVIDNKLLPPPLFTQATNDILSLDDITETNGVIIQIKYDTLAINDRVTVHVYGLDESNNHVQNATWQASHIVSSQNVSEGFIQVKLPLEKAISVGDNGQLFSNYSVQYNSSQGFDYSETSKAKLNMITKPDLQMFLTTGAPPHDYHAIHVYPFNHGIIIGSPGSSVALSCARPAEFDESGSSDYRVTLNESGIARFRLLSPSSGTIVVGGFVESNPGIEASAITQFKSYHDQQGKFIAWASSTNASADEIMPCSIYLITENESSLKRPITQVRVVVSGNAKIVGYPGQTADILLNSDHSVEIDIINSVEEKITATLTLPESSGSIISADLLFVKRY